jgi:riboflavin-specific deaminase-like protein
VLTVHFAQTLDGRIATRTGDSQWIGGPESLRFAHALRAQHDAILVGVGTILADDPQLTVRLTPGASPIRVVLDSRLRIPDHARVLCDQPQRTIIATTSQAEQARVVALRGLGAEVVQVHADDDQRVDLRALLAELGRRGLRAVLIEGGAAVITGVLRLGLADRLVVCIAPRIIGEGVSAVGDLRIEKLCQAITFSAARFEVCGEDLIFDGRPARSHFAAA